MQNFQHAIPAMRIFSGDASLKSLEGELKRLGSSRAMIVCGGSIGRSEALMDKVRTAAGERLAGVFNGAKAHSPVSDVIAASRALRDADADAVIAVGGGSAIVTARAAAILLAEGEDAAALSTRQGEGGRLISPRLSAPKLPQIVLPTTPTTASVKAGSAVFDPDTQSRLALFDPKTRAQSVFLDPDLLASVPRGLLISASINSFAMALEGLISTTGNPFADGQLMQALRLTQQGLAAIDGPDQAQARGDLAIAAMLCGQGTDHSGAGVTIVLGHAIGARYDAENGAVNAVVLPHALRFNGEAGRAGLINVAAALGRPCDAGDDVQAIVLAAVEDVLAPLGAARRLREIGVERTELDGIARAGMGDWFLRGNPRPIGDKAELLGILEAAW